MLVCVHCVLCVCVRVFVCVRVCVCVCVRGVCMPAQTKGLKSKVIKSGRYPVTVERDLRKRLNFFKAKNWHILSNTIWWEKI